MPRVVRNVERLAAPAWSDSEEASGQEDDDQDDEVQDNVFREYRQRCGDWDAPSDDARDDVFKRGLERVQEYLAAGKANTMCLICLGAIKPAEAVWHCSRSCYGILHLTCIQDWAKNQLHSAGSGASAEWGCPKCRHAYPRAAAPSQYTCFCGQVTEPVFDPWLAPHTCGDICGKPLPGSCSHTCVLLCHPGPCPPCPLVVDAACYCGKRRTKQRCGMAEFSCHAQCGRVHDCGHPCPRPCHPGECLPCQRVGAHDCACGAEQRVTTCAERTWQCSRVCGKTLPCGRHSCERVCHAGECGGCPFEGARTCPCGKTPAPGLLCTERAPACAETCGKPLSCGRHTCEEPCHHGPCSTLCRHQVEKACRCGRTTCSVPCHQEVTCARRCLNLRACGKHPCNRRCCDGECPPCEEACNRWLGCHHHRCPAPCHSGPCRPCPLTVRVSCACGRSTYQLPCGAESQALPPRCNQPCPVPAVCRHAATAHRHRCHWGPCPPCRKPCGATLACTHTCAADGCHDQPPPAVAAWAQPPPPLNQAQQQAAAKKAASGKADAPGPSSRAPAAEVAAVAAHELVAARSPGVAPSPCPPCQVPVKVACLGGHCDRQLRCCQAAPFACDRPCGRPLPCGNHACGQPCHAAAPAPGPSAPPQLPPSPCETCERPCARARGCAHACPRRCHPGECPPCAERVSAVCSCGKSALHFGCHELAAIRADAAAAAERLCCAKPCHRQLPHCPHPCRRCCHAGACPDGEACGEEVTVRHADPSCKRKGKWPCSQVQRALQAAGRARTYDATTPLHLLPCDAACAVRQQPTKSKAAPAAAAAPPPPPPLQEGPGSAAAVGAAAAKLGSKRLSRAEREALAAQRLQDQLRAERSRRLVRVAQVVGPAVVVCALAVWVALWLRQTFLAP